MILILIILLSNKILISQEMANNVEGVSAASQLESSTFYTVNPGNPGIPGVTFLGKYLTTLSLIFVIIFFATSYHIIIYQSYSYIYSCFIIIILVIITLILIFIMQTVMTMTPPELMTVTALLI